MPAVMPDIPQAEIVIMDMTNAFRAEQKLGRVAPDPQLAKAARAYAELLARTGLFSHTADGRDAADRAASAGYVHCQIAENLALNLDSRGFETRQLAMLAVDGWKKSPGHRRNLLAPHVTEIGVGVARAPGQHPKYISVQLFGRPRSLAYAFTIVNRANAEVTYSFGGAPHQIKPNYSVKHTACEPGRLAFPAVPVSGAFSARDGQTFTVSAAPGGGYHVKVAGARRVKQVPRRAKRR